MKCEEKLMKLQLPAMKEVDEVSIDGCGDCINVKYRDL
jgi:hypothetical protein